MDRRRFTLATLAASIAAPQLIAAEKPRRYNVAVIGHTGRGNFGHGLDTVWNRNDRTTTIAVADANESGLAKATNKLKLDSSAGYLDYREMLRKVQPDIVAVCPRHVDQHGEMILASIESGARGVYVEKPFVRTPAKADQILAACDKHKAYVAVAHRNRYHPVMQVVAKLVKEGRIGRLLEIRGRGKGDRRGGGEDLWVLGSHVLNMMTVFGGRPTSCSAELRQDGRRVTKDDIRDGAEGLGPLAGNELHARFMLDSGVTAYFDSIANDGTKNQGFGLQLIGSEGVILLHADGSPLAHLILGNPFQPTESKRWLPITSGGVDIEEPDPELIQRVQHHDAAVADLIDAIEQKQQPLCSAAEGALTVEMICSVFESHCRGATVTFPLSQRDHPLKNW